MDSKTLLVLVIVTALVVSYVGFDTFASTVPSTQDVTQLGTGLEDTGTTIGENLGQSTTSGPQDSETSPSTQSTNYSGQVLAGSTTPYLVFNQADYELAMQQEEVVYLYFFANWCPICATHQIGVIQAFNELDEPNAVGFRVNFNDSETSADEVAMARKYNIVGQYTTVLLKNGQQLVKTRELWSTAETKQRIKDAL